MKKPGVPRGEKDIWYNDGLIVEKDDEDNIFVHYNKMRNRQKLKPAEFSQWIRRRD